MALFTFIAFANQYGSLETSVLTEFVVSAAFSSVNHMERKLFRTGTIIERVEA